jgi:hypothetical protein
VFVASRVGLVGGGGAIGILSSWVENLEWRKMNKIREEGLKYENEPTMAMKEPNKIKGK